jgi:hypothetical protein
LIRVQPYDPELVMENLRKDFLSSTLTADGSLFGWLSNLVNLLPPFLTLG